METGNPHRIAMYEEVKALVARKKRESDRARRRYFQPNASSEKAYRKSIEAYRARFVEMLGWPLSAKRKIPAKTPAKVEFVAEDSLSRIYRVWISTLPGMKTYGMYFLPKGRGPFPLVIAQHGGLGTPELCSELIEPTNYTDMTRRLLRRGFAVFAPQLMLWAERFGPKHEKDLIDRQLKMYGGSLAALEIFRIQRSLDYLMTRREIDSARVGMVGLSYGGFYTLFSAAVDTRIKVAASSCFFSNRKVYDWLDWTWFNSGNLFLDPEVACLVCPRPLFIEVGKRDELFDVKLAWPEAQKAAAMYRKLGLADWFQYKEHEGNHMLDSADDWLDFICRHL